MTWKRFHHPDISFPVVHRKASEELLTMLDGIGAMVLTAGASELYGHCYPNPRAFKASLARLRDKGLVVATKTDGSMPGLQLTPTGQEHLPDYCNPVRAWSKPWNKWWYILMFDVPEKDRPYRDTLRRFLKIQRFGCLQLSVWVTPRDVRPMYDDLDRAAAVDSVAFLFEAKTVLGYGDQAVVNEAWDFGRINRIQECYIEFADENLSLLAQTDVPQPMLAQLIRMDNQAYAQCMSLDPLLPKELHPCGYCGVRAFERHRQLIAQIAERLNTLPSRKNSRS